MNFPPFNKMKIFSGLTLLMLLIAPISKSLAGDRKIFTNDDLIRYRYGNGETDGNIAEKNITKDTKKEERPYSDITVILYTASW